jgi:hypothetical protein
VPQSHYLSVHKPAAVVSNIVLTSNTDALHFTAALRAYNYIDTGSAALSTVSTCVIFPSATSRSLGQAFAAGSRLDQQSCIDASDDDTRGLVLVRSNN